MPMLFPGHVRMALCLWEALNVDNIIYLFGNVLLLKPPRQHYQIASVKSCDPTSISSNPPWRAALVCKDG